MLTYEYLVIAEHRRRTEKLSRIVIPELKQKKPSFWSTQLTFLVPRLLSFFNKTKQPRNQKFLPLGVSILDTKKVYYLSAHTLVKVLLGTLLITQEGKDIILRPGNIFLVQSTVYPVLLLTLGKEQSKVVCLVPSEKSIPANTSLLLS